MGFHGMFGAFATLATLWRFGGLAFALAKMASPASRRGVTAKKTGSKKKDEYKQPKRRVCTEIHTVHFFADMVPVATRDSVSRRKFNPFNPPWSHW